MCVVLWDVRLSWDQTTSGQREELVATSSKRREGGMERGKEGERER